MTTGELIEWLKKEDPTGKIPVCVDNHDIYFLEHLPSYYDGRLQRIIQDKNKLGYNIIGAKWICGGDKIKLRTMSVHDCIENNLNTFVDYTDIVMSYKDEERALDYKRSDDACRQETRDIMWQVHNESKIKAAWNHYEI